MSRTTVGVLRGGTSGEYDASLKTGAVILNELPEDRYDTRDIFIDKSGLWHLRGMPVEPGRALAQLDVVLNALHGGVGEDGTVQRILERAGVPFAGSRALSSGLSYNKIRARQIFRDAGIRGPQSIAFSLERGLSTAEMARTVFAQFGPPYVVKPPTDGGGIGILIAESVVQLPDALGDILDAYGAALVEEYIRGREATVALLEDFRGDALYAFPPARVHVPEGVRTIDALQARKPIRYAAPSDFSHEEKEDLMAIARAAHKALALSHFSRADIMVTARGVPYLLEVNATPKLHEGAALPAMLESVGSSVREFLEHSIELARRS